MIWEDCQDMGVGWVCLLENECFVVGGEDLNVCFKQKNRDVQVNLFSNTLHPCTC